jgi:hypothetical protein
MFDHPGLALFRAPIDAPEPPARAGTGSIKPPFKADL